MRQVKVFLITLFLCISFGFIKASSSDSIRVSLITCSPGSEIYSLFGHTAIRIENPITNQDIVFNYGVFSFDTPNFVWRFVKGETDYQLGISQFVNFEFEYFMRGSDVIQQILNLLPEEKERIWNILIENYRPENRIYRYNYFFDNCTTRARDKIEESISGKIVYEKDERPLTYRNIIHEYTKGYEWSQFGIDLCLGSKADEIADYRQKMFAPFYLMKAMETAEIVGTDNVKRACVLSTQNIVEGDIFEEDEVNFPLTPKQLNWIFFIMILIISLLEFNRRKIFWGIDILLFGCAGVAGCILAFLVFFSVHSAVSPNYLLFFMHPFHLLYLPFMIYFSIKKKRDWYQWINLIVLTLFIALWEVFPQRFNPAVLPLALCLLIRSLSHVVLSFKFNK